MKITLALVLFSVVAVAAAPTGRYKVIVDSLTTLQASHADISHLFSMGANDDGVEIHAMRVSLTPTISNPAKVAHLVVSTHHGNELKAPTLTMHFLTMLLEKFRSDEIFRGRLADTEWVIVPVLNVPGYNAGVRTEKGRDSNRDYPGPCISQTGGSLKSIRNLMNFMTTRTFVGSLTVHGYLGALTYPWGVDTANTHTADHNAFESIVRRAAAINGYRYGTSTDVVYPADGTFEDFAYWKHGLWSLLLELRSNPSDTDINKTSEAAYAYFDALDSSPSTSHALTSGCQRSGRLDLGIE